MRRVLVALVLVSAPTGALSLEIGAPSHAPIDGTPFEVHVSASGLAGPADLKAWLGGADWQASRTWDGAAWTRSDRYALAIEPGPDGSFEGWVALAANPDSANAGELAALETATLGVRLRVGDEVASARAATRVMTAPHHLLVGLAAGQAAESREAGVLLARRSNPTSAPRVVALAVPTSDARVCVETTCRPADVRLAAAGDTYAVVEARAPADLTGAVIVLAGGACALAGSLGAGEQLLVGAPPSEGWTRALATLPCVPSAVDARPGQLLHLGEALDAAPTLPGRGAAVREPWGDHPWAPWRLADGVLPSPIETLDVAGRAKPFETRREGLATVLDVIGGARERLTVATYLFTNERVAGALAAAAARGVSVVVLVEPDPIGGRSPDEDAVLADLSADGVDVRWATGPWSARGVQHAKVIVADGVVLVVLTENLTRSGLPDDGRGNVGWGIGVANETLARRVERGFVGTSRAASSWAPASWSPFHAEVSLLWSPENAWRLDGVPDLLARSSGPVRGLVLEANPTWGPRPNPWLEALVNASARASVRLILNGVAGGEPVPANEASVAHLASRPGAGELDVRLSDPRMGVVHGKGIVTSEWVLVGSSNWGLGGALLNRELDLIVHDPGTAAFFAAAFDGLWAGEEGAPAAAPLPATLVPVAGLFGAAVRLACSGALPRRSAKSGRERDEPVGSEAEEGFVADRVCDADDGGGRVGRQEQADDKHERDEPRDQGLPHVQDLDLASPGKYLRLASAQPNGCAVRAGTRARPKRWRRAPSRSRERAPSP